MALTAALAGAAIGWTFGDDILDSLGMGGSFDNDLGITIAFAIAFYVVGTRLDY